MSPTQMKRSGILVVSLRGINQGFWSHLWCSSQSANIFSRQCVFKGALKEIYDNKKNALFSVLGSIFADLSSPVY